jgi:hypothetical protein
MDSEGDQLRTLRAAIDRIIPADDFPSASQAGVDRFIVALLKGDRKGDAQAFDAGLAGLDAEAQAQCGKTFADCASGVQDEILTRVEAGAPQAQWKTQANRFFEMLLNLTAEGYFSDPANGGNRDALSWKMVGYDPGANEP